MKRVKVVQIKKYYLFWWEEEYSKIILTNVLELHIIELPKLNKHIDDSKIKKEDKILNTWIKFMLNPEEIGEEEMSGNDEIKKAKEELNKIQQDEGKREAARDTVLNMYKKNFDIKTICDITNLRKEEVEKIIKKDE